MVSGFDAGSLPETEELANGVPLAKQASTEQTDEKIVHLTLDNREDVSTVKHVGEATEMGSPELPAPRMNIPGASRSIDQAQQVLIEEDMIGERGLQTQAHPPVHGEEATQKLINVDSTVLKLEQSEVDIDSHEKGRLPMEIA